MSPPAHDTQKPKPKARSRSKPLESGETLAAAQKLAVLAELVPDLARALGPDHEVVVHDLARIPNSIIAIAGDITGRSIGGSITDLLLRAVRQGNTKSIFRYRSRTSDGRTLASSTVFVREPEGTAVGCLCINRDITGLLAVQALAEQLAPIAPISESRDDSEPPSMRTNDSPPQKETFVPTVDELALVLVNQAIENVGVPPDLMQKRHKARVIQEMSCELYTQSSGELRQDLLRGIKLVKQCQEMGIDETSVSSFLQWLLVLKDMEIIDDSHLDGVPLAWGNVDAQVELTRRIIYREGVGDVFANGLLAAAQHLDGRTSPEPRAGVSTYHYAMQVNNNPMYGINPRVKSMALAYAVGRRSDCISDLNMQDFDMMSVSAEYPGWTDEQREAAFAFDAETARYVSNEPKAADFDAIDGKAIIVHDMGRTVGMADMAGTCKQHMKWLYLDANPGHMAAAISAGIGKPVSGDDLMWASLQLRTLERALECKWGRRREHDTIPEKEFDKLVSQGAFKGKSFTSREDLEAMKDEYYWLRGWDKETGIPYEETLRDFGLDNVADDLDRLGILPRCTDEAARREGIAKASTLGYVWPELVGRDNPRGNRAPWAQDEPEWEADARLTSGATASNVE